jgi:hypothetical protein
MKGGINSVGRLRQFIIRSVGREDSPPGTGGVDAPIAEGEGADGVVGQVQNQKNV